MSKLSSEAYVAAKGDVCPNPNCGSEDLSEVGGADHDATQVLQGVRCNACKCTWKDVYVLGGYTELRDPHGDPVGSASVFEDPSVRTRMAILMPDEQDYHAGPPFQLFAAVEHGRSALSQWIEEAEPCLHCGEKGGGFVTEVDVPEGYVLVRRQGRGRG